MKLTILLFILYTSVVSAQSLEDIERKLETFEPKYSRVISQVAVYRSMGLFGQEKRLVVTKMNFNVYAALRKTRDAIQMYDTQSAQDEFKRAQDGLRDLIKAIESNPKVKEVLY